MARVVILGAGISGHTAALVLRRRLSREHEVLVVTPNRQWNWIPSNIWVGVGLMKKEDVTFELKPVYDRQGITLRQARALEIHPEGSESRPKPFVTIESTEANEAGIREDVRYDYLINATGPKLNFGATPGLGPDENSLSVCTYGHAEQTAQALAASIERMKQGEKLTFVVGTGHGTCTCEGAAFEYIFNLEFEIRRAGVRDNARIVMLTNEAELGDFGVDGLQLERGGYVIPSKVFAESLFVERGVEWITGAHVKKVAPNLISYEILDGESHSLEFDFAMLLPPFSGVGIKAFDRAGRAQASPWRAPQQPPTPSRLRLVSAGQKAVSEDWTRFSTTNSARSSHHGLTNW